MFGFQLNKALDIGLSTKHNAIIGNTCKKI